MKHHNGDRVKLGYHDHYVVDGGKARIILAALVTPADVILLAKSETAREATGNRLVAAPYYRVPSSPPRLRQQYPM
jgi:hypothetical protein